MRVKVRAGCESARRVRERMKVGKAHVRRVDDFRCHPVPRTSHCCASLIVCRQNSTNTEVGQLDVTLFDVEIKCQS